MTQQQLLTISEKLSKDNQIPEDMKEKYRIVHYVLFANKDDSKGLKVINQWLLNHTDVNHVRAGKEINNIQG